MPRVSVIISTFNRARLIRETLSSVFAQTYTDYECLVIDDGSSDNTRAAIEDLLPRVIYLPISHSGGAAANNTGLASARGDYVAFLDSDDLWDARFLERMTAALAAAPWAGFVYCDYSTFDEPRATRSAWLKPDEKLQGDIFGNLLITDFIANGSLLIRRTCFEAVTGFDTQFVVAYDWDLWLRLAMRFKATYVDETLTHIRVHPIQLTKNRLAIYQDNLGIMRKLRRSYADEVRPYHSIIRQHTRHFQRALAAYYWQARRPLFALQHLANWIVATLL
jgi:glycosyltransferase involved in cell wall biosynthesis